MQIIQTIISNVIIAGAFQGVFLAVILFSIKRGNSRANRALALLLFSFSISIGHAIIPPLFNYQGFLFKLGDPNQLLFGPFFYFYVLLLTRPHAKLKLTYILHFVPFMLLAIFSIFVISHFEKSIVLVFLWIFIVVHMWCYLFFSYQLITLHKERIRETFSNIEKINLKWLGFIITLLALVYCYYILFIPLLIHSSNPYDHFNRGTTLVLAILVYGLGYRGLIQPEIFTGNYKHNLDDINEAKQFRNENSIESKNKYEKSALLDHEITNGLEHLQKIVIKEKLFLNPELTIKELSEKSGFPSHHISQIINSGTGKNFYDFINAYRIEEVKNYLADPEKIKHHTLLSLALDAGFNSKATFNKMFKKVEGITPSQYVKNMNAIIIS